MANLILYHTKESTIEFSVDVAGVDTEDMRVCFVIETKDMDLSFTCKNDKEKMWKCVIAPLRFLEKTTYPYRIDVCADGYYLKGTTGTISIASSVEIYTTEPKNTTITSPVTNQKEDEKPINKKEEFIQNKQQNNIEPKNKKDKQPEEKTDVSVKESLTKEVFQKPRKPVEIFENLNVDNFCSLNTEVEQTSEKDLLIKNILKEEGLKKSR